MFNYKVFIVTAQPAVHIFRLGSVAFLTSIEDKRGMSKMLFFFTLYPQLRV